MSEVKLTPKEFFEMLANMFNSGASGYYLNAGDWKLAAPYVLDLQDIAASLQASESARVEAENKLKSSTLDTWALLRSENIKQGEKILELETRCRVLEAKLKKCREQRNRQILLRTDIIWKAQELVTHHYNLNVDEADSELKQLDSTEGEK